MPVHRLRSLMHLSHRLNGKDPATWTLWSTAYFCNCTRTYTVPRNRNGNRIGDLLSQSWLPHTSRVSILEMLSARIVRSFLRIFCSLVYDRCREFAWVWRTPAVSWMGRITNFREKSLHGNGFFRWNLLEVFVESRTLNQLKAVARFPWSSYDSYARWKSYLPSNERK